MPQRAGTYTITAWASNAAGSSPARTLILTVNPSSTAAIALSVSGNGIFSFGETVSMSASGRNMDSSVEFLVNGSVVASSGGTPHSANWSTAIPGVYQLQARSAGVYSSVREVAVMSADADNVAITITSPQSGASVPGSHPVLTISGTLMDTYGDVSSVSIYANSQLLGDATLDGNSFSFDWAAVRGYDQRIKAVANLHSGQGVQSDVILLNITQSARPIVEILSPSPTVPVDFREALRFNGRAEDPDGSIVRVELWLGTHNRGNDTFDTFLGNATLNPDGTWTYLAGSNLRNGTLPIYAIAIDNSGDKTFSSILRVFRSARFADHAVYGDAGTYSMDLGDNSRWDLLQDGDNVVLLNKERFGYNYDWQNFLPNSRLEHFRLSGRFKLPHYPEPSSPDFTQAVLIGFGGNKTVFLNTAVGSNSGGTRVYYSQGMYNFSIVNAAEPAIASNDWIDFEVVRVGNTLTVKLNGQTWMSATSNNLTGDGSIYIGNPRLNGSRVYWE
ncbi:MAG: Ig-like domain-containing protein [Verrucomicrobia bacterium]|nr:Ig-like domain-containing protein [Verrucomicrobiota bacterium]